MKIDTKKHLQTSPLNRTWVEMKLHSVGHNYLSLSHIRVVKPSRVNSNSLTSFGGCSNGINSGMMSKQLKSPWNYFRWRWEGVIGGVASKEYEGFYDFTETESWDCFMDLSRTRIIIMGSISINCEISPKENPQSFSFGTFNLMKLDCKSQN